MQDEEFFFFSYCLEAIGTSMVDIKADNPNDGSTGQRPGSNGSIGELLLLIY